MNERDEERLREAFQEVRTDVRGSGSVPDFRSMWAEAKRVADERPALEVVAGGAGAGSGRASRRRLFRAGAWGTAAVAAAVSSLILVTRGPSGDDDFEQLVAAYSAQVGGDAWRSPTSGLLDVPGMDLTRSVPSIGAPVRGIDPSTLQAPGSSPDEENL